MRKLLQLSLLLFVAASAFGYTTWYVDAVNGGTRYSTYNTSGQCNGQSPNAYVSGVNQACPYNDFRYLYDDSDAHYTWVISGGDTVIVTQNYQSGQAGWRTGPNGPNASDMSSPGQFCYGSGAPVCWNLNPIPAGTAGHPTQILGSNYASCTSNSAKSQIFGGYGNYWVLDLSGAQYVTLACLEITTHNSTHCVYETETGYSTPGCSGSSPFTDAAQRGLKTSATTSNLVLQDVNIHGLPEGGVQGPVGGLYTLTRVRLAFNAQGPGWNWDNGSDTPNASGATFSATNLIAEGNGCLEEYPIVDSFPAIACFDSAVSPYNVYADGLSAQDSNLNFSCNQCIFRYNTKNGLDLGHIMGSPGNLFYGPGTLSITNSYSYGNMDRPFSFGAALTTGTLTNNLIIGNCTRMSQALPGAPIGYNAGLSAFCRSSGDNIPITQWGGNTWTFEHNTFLVGGATMFDFQCADTSTCSSNTFTIRDNIFLAYTDPNYSGDAGEAPAGFYCGEWAGEYGSVFTPTGFVRDHNIFYGFRTNVAGGFAGGCAAPGTAFTNESNSDAGFVNEPAINMNATNGLYVLDNYNFNLTSGSPANGMGVAISGQTVDYNGYSWASPPSMGALEYRGSSGTVGSTRSGSTVRSGSTQSQ
jgi:hypothetical protein